MFPCLQAHGLLPLNARLSDIVVTLGMGVVSCYPRGTGVACVRVGSYVSLALLLSQIV